MASACPVQVSREHGADWHKGTRRADRSPQVESTPNNSARAAGTSHSRDRQFLGCNTTLYGHLGSPGARQPSGQLSSKRLQPSKLLFHRRKWGGQQWQTVALFKGKGTGGAFFLVTL